MSDPLRSAFDHEWRLAVAARRSGSLETAFHHLERAHILGQRQTWPHMKSHLGMWRIGWLRGDWRELIGQLTRLFAALLFSRVWVPIGNTGGAHVSAFAPMTIPADLRVLLDQADQSRSPS